MVWDYLELEGGESNLIGDYSSEVVYASFVPRKGNQRFHATSIIVYASMSNRFTQDAYDRRAVECRET